MIAPTLFCVTDRVTDFRSMRLGEILIARGKLDAAGVERALRLQKEGGEKLGALLVTLGLCAQRDVSEALAAQLGLPLVDAGGYPEFPVLEERISARFLREARALPLQGGRARAGARDGRSDGQLHDRRVPHGHRARGEAAGRDSVRARRGARAPLRRGPHGGRARSSATSSSATSSRSTPTSSS